MKLYYLKKCGLLMLLLILNVVVVKAQSGSISGKIIDEANQPLPGAAVFIDGTSLGTQTDVNGNYKISGIKSGNVSVTVRFVGYVEQKKQVTISTTPLVLNFSLVPENKSLNEVVVIGYGSVAKKDLTGAVTAVSSKDFQRGNIVSPEQLIAGKVSGVQITSNSGAPGSGSTIRIRGGASLNASNDPLIVIDGVPVSVGAISGAANPLSLINPNDIETFTVLKDASATAIYGSRASNGVILITTKKGSSGKPVVSFNSQLSASTLGSQIDVLSAQELRDYVTNNPRATAQYIGYLGESNTNWQNEIYQTATNSDNNLSISGAVKNIPYRVAVGYLDQRGVLLRDKLNRTSGSLSVTPKFFDNHLKVDVNVKGSLSKSRFANQGAIGAALQFDPTQPVYEENIFGGFFEYANGSGANAVPNPNAPRNPMGLIMQREDNSEVNRSLGNIQLDYMFHFLPELHANLNLGYDVAKGTGSTFVPEFAAQSFSTRGSRTQYLQEINNKIGEFYLNYNKNLRSLNSNINVTAGYGYYDNRTTNFNYPNLRANGDVIPGTEPTFPFDIPRNNLQSYYGRMIYTLSDKYIVSASIRTDGSSRFSEDVRWGVFPSASFTWRAKSESFLQNVQSLSDLKLRVSYGITGQQDGISNFSYLPNYAVSQNDSQYQFGNQFFNLFVPIAYDSNIKWEETETYNAGIDYGFLNNRINGSIDVYFKKTKDLLANVPIPVGSNFNNFLLTNIGNVENRGLEFNISADAIKTKDFNWNLGFNLTLNRSRITNLTLVPDPNFNILVGGFSGGTGGTIQTHSVGFEPFSFYVYKQVYDTNGKPLEGVYEDLNGDGVISEAGDLYRYKSPAPDALLGFSTQLNYKKWSFSTVLRANFGNYMYNNVASNFGVERNILNPSGYVANATSEIFRSQFINNQYLSDYYIENASFLRMDNIGLGYNLGRLSKASSANLRLNLNCQNVFVISNYSGLDPEIGNGIDFSLYPRTRTFSLGLNLDF